MTYEIQKGTETAYNRYPDVFYVAKRYFEARSATPHILCFGCSTGEEPFTLAERYFPSATIVGVDVSGDVLAIARRNNIYGKRLVFHHSTPIVVAQNGPYDAIFAMSVLCRWPESGDIDNISELYSFASFELHVEMLHSCLRPGGMLVTYNSNFSFMDSAVSSSYDIVLSKHVRSNGFVKRFDCANQAVRLEGVSDCMYVKRFDEIAASLDGLLRFLNEDGVVIGTLPRTLRNSRGTTKSKVPRLLSLSGSRHAGGKWEPVGHADGGWPRSHGVNQTATNTSMVEWAQSAVRADPANGWSHYQLSIELQRSGDLPGAATAVEAAIAGAGNATPADFLRHLSEIRCEQGRIDEAISLARQARQANLYDPWTCLHLARMLMLVHDLDAAVETAKQALGVAQQIKSGAFSRGLSEIYVERKEPERALAWARKAVLIDETDEWSQNHLAGVLLSFGDLDGAERAARLALIHSSPSAIDRFAKIIRQIEACHAAVSAA